MQAPLAVLALLAVGLTGCLGGSPDFPDPEETEVPEPVEPTPFGEEIVGSIIGSQAFARGARDGYIDAADAIPENAEPARGFDPRFFEARELGTPGDEAIDTAGAFRGRPGLMPPQGFPTLVPAQLCIQQEFDESTTALFDAVVEDLDKDFDFLSGSLAVSDRCGIIHARGFGIQGSRPWADSFVSAATSLQGYIAHVVEPVTPDTMFRIASLTKPLTGGVINHMVDEGLIAMDDHVFCPSSSYAEPTPLNDGTRCLLAYDPATGPGAVYSWVTPGKRTITVEDLLRHRSGWDRNNTRNGDFMFMPFQVADAVGGSVPPSQDDWIRFGLSQPIYYTPGTTSDALDRYSNFAFMLLGTIIEKYGSKSYMDYLRQDFFGPAGVPAAQVHASPSLPSGFHPDEVYYPCGGKKTTPFPGQTADPVCAMYGGYVLEPQLAHGAVVTTASALALWMKDYWVHDWASAGKGLPRTDYYDFPASMSFHNGAYAGVKTLMMQCTNGLNFALLTNFAGGGFPYWDLADEFCDAGDAFYEAGPFHAQVWASGDGDDWVERRGLTGAQHQAAFDSLSGQGYFLEDIACYDLNGEARYTSTWSKRAVSWSAAHGVSQADMQTGMDDAKENGKRAATLSACNVGGSIRWNAVWIHDPDATWGAFPGEPSSAFQTRFDAMVQGGYRLVDLAVYEEGGVAQYASAWHRVVTPTATESRSGTAPTQPVAWAAHLGLSVTDFSDKDFELHNQGLHLVDVSVVQLGSNTRYSGIWAQDGDPSPPYWLDVAHWDVKGLMAQQAADDRHLVSLAAT